MREAIGDVLCVIDSVGGRLVGGGGYSLDVHNIFVRERAMRIRNKISYLKLNARARDVILILTLTFCGDIRYEIAFQPHNLIEQPRVGMWM